MHPADPSPEEGSPPGAGTEDEFAGDTSVSEPELPADATSELPFGADQPGFTDWRVELRERLKKIRARRESEQREADLPGSEEGGETVDDSEAPTLDEFEVDTAEADETQELQLSGDDNVIELAEVLGGPDVSVDEVDDITATSDDEDEGDWVAGEEEWVADEESAEEVLEEAIAVTEIESTAETAAELIDQLIVDEPESAAPAGSGPAATGWDSDGIAGLKASAAEAPASDLEDEVLVEEESTVIIDEEAETVEEAVDLITDEIVGEVEIAEDAAGGDPGEGEIIGEITQLEESGEAAAEEPTLDESALEDLIADEEHLVLGDDQEVELDEALDVIAATHVEPLETVELGEARAAELAFDDGEAAQIEAAPDLELDIDELPPEADAGIEWDTPESPELMRPATSGLDRSAAPLGQRVIAGIADALVLVIIGAVLVGAASSAAGAAYDALLTDAPLPLALTWAIFAFGYIVFFTGTCGQTIGKMIMKLRVVSTDQLSVGFGRATKRLSAAIPSILVLGIGFFLAARDPKRRTFYDRVAQTRVIRA